jgi:hypothetical protein
MKAFNCEKDNKSPVFLWAHFFTGIFFHVFLYLASSNTLVFGKDRAYSIMLYWDYPNAMLTVAQAEYPP